MPYKFFFLSMELAKSLGVAIEERRLTLDMSQAELATATDLHRNFVGRVERGEVVVSVDTLDKLAKALRCPVGHLWSAAERHSKSS